MNYKTSAQSWSSSPHYDEGLRQYMISIYQYMGMALGLTALVSYMVGNTPQLVAYLFSGPMGWIVALAPLGYAFFFSYKLPQMSKEQALMHLSIFAGLNGLSLSSIFMVYTTSSIVQTFLATSGMFLGMSLYGYTTKKDLTKLGSIATMAVLGLVIASVINLFFPSDQMSFIISLIGIVAFSVLTAYDTQKLKNIYDQMGGNMAKASNISVYGALCLYLDFINLFVMLLRFCGARKD